MLAGIFRSARLETRSQVARLTLPRNFAVSGAEFAENRLISLVEMIGRRIHGLRNENHRAKRYRKSRKK